MEYDKINGNVAFQEGPHKYFNVTDPSIQYTSVTTLIGKYEQPFDKEFVSKYKALEKLVPADSWKKEKGSIWKNHKIPKDFLEVYDISKNDLNRVQQDILDEWEKINKESCERGTKIHSAIEQAFYKAGNSVNLKKFGIGGKFICKKDYSDLDLEYGVYPEYLIYYDNPKLDLHIAGQIDLLVKNGNNLIIGDHKGLPLDTPIATKDGWKTMEELKIGDKVFDKNGNLCNVTIKSSIHHNPCYKINFDNSESIIADCDHKWEISFSTQKTSRWHGNWRTQIMTTEELYAYLEKLSTQEKVVSSEMPKIVNCKPIKCEEKILPIDPYVLGCWLGDGSKSCGIITNETNNIWGEIQSRGYELGDNLSKEDHCEMRTVLGLRTGLRQLNLLNNKHIPDIYLRSSYNQRLDLLRGLMDTDGYYNPIRKRFVMDTNQSWQKEDMIKLCASLGIKVTVFDIITKLNGKEFPGWSVNFSTLGLNPFLSRNQEIEYPSRDYCSFRRIKSVESCDMVPTQCIAVDSPSHTYLAGYSMIVTHNTNKKIDLKSFYDSGTRSTKKMKYPLGNLDDCNYQHYSLQLSTYAWMLQKLNPDFKIERLFLNHYDHEGNNKIYEVQYLKDEVEKMLKHFAKQNKLDKQKQKYARIEY